jgi:hypothetical protein
VLRGEYADVCAEVAGLDLMRIHSFETKDAAEDVGEEKSAEYYWQWGDPSIHGKISSLVRYIPEDEALECGGKRALVIGMRGMTMWGGGTGWALPDYGAPPMDASAYEGLAFLAKVVEPSDKYVTFTISDEDTSGTVVDAKTCQKTCYRNWYDKNKNGEVDEGDTGDDLDCDGVIDKVIPVHQRCTDWRATMELSANWQFVRVPWRDFQILPKDGKVSSEIKTDTLNGIHFRLDAPQEYEIWIDGIYFYRAKSSEGPS